MLRIVLADDNVRAADGLARAIDYASLGYVCSGVAYNGKQALDLALRHRANVVITDVRMPIMDGLELSRRLRAEVPGVSIIILSAYDDFEYARTALTTGVEDYVLKPLDRSKIRGIVEILTRIRERLERRAAVLGRLTGGDIRAQIAACLEGEDAAATAARVRALLEPAGGDFSCAREAGSRILTMLHDHTARGAPAPARISQERHLEALGTQSDVEGVVACVAAAARELSDYLRSARHAAGRGMIGAITAHIDATYRDATLTVRGLLARYRVSSSWLHQAFRSHLGVTPNAYITAKRLEHARELLARGESVAEAARASGYVDPHYFGRVFRKHFGVSPAGHRKLTLARTRM